MSKPSTESCDRFSRRLKAALALKDFAVAHNLKVDPDVRKTLNKFSVEEASSVNADRMNQLDDAISRLTAITYPTGIDTVGVSPDPDIAHSFKFYRLCLAVFGLVLTVVGVITYYQCRVLAVSGDLTTRSAQIQMLTQTLEDARKAVRDSQGIVTKETNELKELEAKQNSPVAAAGPGASGSIAELEPSNDDLKVVKGKIAVVKGKIADATVALNDATARETLAKTKLAEAEREIAWSELWPAVFAATLGALGACVYLLYALIGAFSDSRMTMTALYSEMVRLPIGAIVGWIVYVAFCQANFRQSFLSQSGPSISGKEFTNEAILLLPFLAGYSSKLVVEILNRLIDAVRTTMGIKTESVGPAATSTRSRPVDGASSSG
jgi:F0F1-type ATP synthase membrane subunit b/b'